MRSFALNLRLKWLLGVHGRLSRKQGPRVWSFLFEAWAREIIGGKNIAYRVWDYLLFQASTWGSRKYFCESQVREYQHGVGLRSLRGGVISRGSLRWLHICVTCRDFNIPEAQATLQTNSIGNFGSGIQALTLFKSSLGDSPV